jgi:crotonobetainyl-CoA:carnitine CoA-transferase CaiB-like acyl-CoA transferase
MSLLESVTVVDFSQYFPGPYATLRLADWGARVVKVEPPAGDPSRRHSSVDGGDGTAFRALNRGKPSVCLDLKDGDDRRRALDLVATADVLVEGFRPGTMSRLGLGYDVVSAANPGIVYCSVTGYGQDTSIARLSGHDLNYLALSGVASQLTDEHGRPVLPKVALVDTVAGIAASEAILAGLVQRGRTGRGTYLDVSMTEAVQALLVLHVTEFSAHGHGVSEEPVVSYHVYETSDGRYVTLAAMEDKFWAAFCEGVGRPDLLGAKGAPAVPGNPAYEAMVALVASRTFAQWVEFFRGHDCCFAPVLGLGELAGFPPVAERGLVGSRSGLDYLATHFLDRADFLGPGKTTYALGENDLGH